MKTIDLIVLGMIKEKPQSAQELLNNIAQRNIVYWIKTSESSDFKKVIALEQKGYLEVTKKAEASHIVKYYKITAEGERYLERCLDEGVEETLRLFLDYNAIIINLGNVSQEKRIAYCRKMHEKIDQFNKALIGTAGTERQLKPYGEMIVEQQILLGKAMEKWIQTVEKTVGEESTE